MARLVGPGWRPTRRTGVAAGAVGLVVIVVAGVMLSGGQGVRPIGSAAPGASGVGPGQAASSLAPGGAYIPGAPLESSAPSAAADWSPVSVPAYAPVADLVASDSDAAGVAADATFTLTSRNGERPEALADRLQVDPSVELKVSPSSGRAVVRPAAPLDPGELYRFSLHAPDGSLQGSWAFQVREPLHVVGTLPYNEATGVPIDTGIEVTFDHDGFSRAPSYFEIQPAVRGTFAIAGRVLAFVPSALQPKTVYRVTIRKGLPLDGSDQALEEDVTFAFETGTPEKEPPETSLAFERRVFEASASEPAVLTVSTQEWSDAGPKARTLSGSLYRFANVPAALAALSVVEAAPSWTRWQHADLVPTPSLQRVGTFDLAAAPVSRWDNRLWFQLPAALQAGWYLVSLRVDGVELQAFLQATDIATYVSVLSDRSVFWVHDLASGRPLPGASVELTGGGVLGRTDTQGLLIVPTPPRLAPTAASETGETPPLPDATVRSGDGRTATIAGSMWQGSRYSYYGNRATQDYWLAFYTDRRLYRQTDTVNAWGVVRARGTGAPPSEVTVRLTTGGYYDGSGPEAPAVVERRLTPNQAGVFSASLPIEDLPIGGYAVELWAGGELLTDSWLSVDIIRKPVYRLAVDTDRHVYLAGEPIHVTVSASFYDGTPVAGAWLALGDRHLTTDSTGRATATVTAAIDYAGAQESFQWLGVGPVRAEEGDVSASTTVEVFASRVLLQARARFDAAEIAVDGDALLRDLAKAEQAISSQASDRGPYYPGSANEGTPLKGTTVTAIFVGLIPVTTRIGETYDFISKKVVPIYHYDTKDVPLGSKRVVTDAGGSFAFELPVTDETIRSCTVTLTARDAQGRVATLEASAWRPPPEEDVSTGAGPGTGTEVEVWSTVDDVAPARPYLALEGDPAPQRCSWSWSYCAAQATYHVGETARIVMRDDRSVFPVGGANGYLFLVEQQGLRQVMVQDSSHLALPFDEASIPNVYVSGIRFTGATYQVVSDGFVASLDERDRQLDVTVQPDAPAYRPGGDVTLRITTRATAGGAPVATTLVLTGVDQKLYDMGVASDASPLQDLYANLGSGVTLGYASHQYPIANPQGGASTGGGGGGPSIRDDFRDTALFRRVTTDGGGRATVTFQLPDDITSWHVSAYAVTRDLQAGAAQVSVVASLPFFVDVALAPEYLASDRPSVRLRAQGDALDAGDRVTFTVSSDTLGMAPRTVTAGAFTEALVALPPLREGPQRLVVQASVGSGANRHTDAVARTFNVVASRLSAARTRSEALGPGYVPTGGAGLTTYTFSDAGRGRFLGLLQSLAWNDGPRLDQALAASQARDLIERYFPTLTVDAPPPTFDAVRYERSESQRYNLHLLALLPYASGDLELTVRALLAAPEAFSAQWVRDGLPGIRTDPASTAERKLLALVGLAAVGEPILADLRLAAAAASDATPTMRLYTALGLAALGDDQGALAIERELLGRYGERYGSLVRLRVSWNLSENAEVTALFAMLAAGLGDPLGDAAEAYVESNPSVTSLLSLQQLAYVRRAIERAPATPARVAYSVDGKRVELALGAGQSASIRLTATQRASFGAETVLGSAIVTTSWQAPLDAAAVTQDPSLRVTRAVAPTGTLPPGQLAVVTLRVTVSGQQPSGCYRLVESVPSGLVALPSPVSYDSSGTPYGATEQKVNWPWYVSGQRVIWYICDTSRPARYLVRVLTPGTYAWEPAMLQMAAAPERLALSAAGTISAQ